MQDSSDYQSTWSVDESSLYQTHLYLDSSTLHSPKADADPAPDVFGTYQGEYNGYPPSLAEPAGGSRGYYPQPGILNGFLAPEHAADTHTPAFTAKTLSGPRDYVPLTPDGYDNPPSSSLALAKQSLDGALVPSSSADSILWGQSTLNVPFAAELVRGHNLPFPPAPPVAPLVAPPVAALVQSTAQQIAVPHYPDPYELLCQMRDWPPTTRGDKLYKKFPKDHRPRKHSIGYVKCRLQYEVPKDGLAVWRQSQCNQIIRKGDYKRHLLEMHLGTSRVSGVKEHRDAGIRLRIQEHENSLL
ncbi:SubName: Full=Uncharacterized protein {ECO:0000313/EMBL:CCA76883.1} [Serendipita indica DSM 11827]|nr:SubName: Full=Uncharacterized protein {ECO:0000313/EMBL:CCA76883.1} [Serendipita indica DSM 11827]